MYVVVKCPDLASIARFLNNNSEAKENIIHIERENGAYSLLIYDSSEEEGSELIYINDRGKVTGGV